MIVKRVAETEGVLLELPKTPSPAAATSATDFIRVEDVEKFGREHGKE